jgi:hypothetical protein
MSDPFAPPAPSGPGRDLTASLLRQLVIASVIVVVAAGLFLALGRFGSGLDGAMSAEEQVEAPIVPEPVAPVPPIEEDETTIEDVEVIEEEEEPESDRVDPATIRIQVLDGVRDDARAAADAVTKQLEELGYIIANRSEGRRYEASVVFWGDDGEALARQVAADLGITDIRPNPGTLDAAIPVHVMVGADQG